MKKRNIIIIIIVSALLVVLLLWKSGVFNKKKTTEEPLDNDGENGDGNGSDIVVVTDKEKLTGEKFDDLEKVPDYGILNPNKESR